MQNNYYSKTLGTEGPDGDGIVGRYSPGEPQHFVIAMQDGDGRTFRATVHYKYHPLGTGITVCKVVTSSDCDITHAAAVENQMPYLRKKAEMDAIAKNLTSIPIDVLTIATYKNNRHASY